MTRVFSHLPIRLKLIAMILTACAAAVVLASLAYLVVDYYQTRGELERDLRAQADLILQNSLAAHRAVGIRRAGRSRARAVGRLPAPRRKAGRPARAHQDDRRIA